MQKTHHLEGVWCFVTISLGPSAYKKAEESYGGVYYLDVRPIRHPGTENFRTPDIGGEMMGFLDLLFPKKKENKTDVTVGEITSTMPTQYIRSGHVEVEQIILDVPTTDLLRNEFIAFDVETTGLNSTLDRIVEIGAVLFVKGQPTDSFSSLVNSGITISPSASAVNHITKYKPTTTH